MYAISENEPTPTINYDCSLIYDIYFRDTIRLLQNKITGLESQLKPDGMGERCKFKNTV